MTVQPVRNGTSVDGMTLTDIVTLSEILAQSGFFSDSRSPAQCVAKILAGKELGFGAIAAMTGVYIVKGRVTLSANLIAAAIKRHGRYDYRVKRLDNQACEIEFRDGDEPIGSSTFTLADAKAAGLGGDNWNRYPRNMLFARALSNGAKWYCPDVFGGPIYTPEELGEEEDAEEPVERPAIAPPVEIAATPAAAAPAAAIATEATPPAPADRPAAEPARTNGSAKRADVRCAEWTEAARGLAADVPFYQRDGRPDWYRLTAAAARLGYEVISTENLGEVITALERFGLQQGGQAAARGAAPARAAARQRAA
jgi:hypothetical protein